MAFLTAAVAFFGALSLFNLALLLGVIRRLRRQDGMVPRLPAGPPVRMAGAEIDAFTATTTTGETVGKEHLAGTTFVAFLSTTCRPCKSVLPRLVEVTRNVPGGRGQVLAVVVGSPEDAREYVAELAPVAHVVVEPPGEGTVTGAFSARGFPSFAVVETGGKIRSSGFDLHQPTQTAKA